MVRRRQASEVFETEFLPVRAKLLEVAAALDRLDRAQGSMDGDSRRSQIGNAIETLLQDREDRAEQIQLIFSRPYEEDWRRRFRMTNDK